jgi:hypothetical protein
MASVINSTDLLNRFDSLGWTTSRNDLLSAVEASGIPSTVIVAYLDALIAASPGPLNDQTITGVTTAQGTAITPFLKGRGLVA